MSKDGSYAAEVVVVREECKPFQQLPSLWSGRVSGLCINVFQWARLQASNLLRALPQKRIKFEVSCGCYITSIGLKEEVAAFLDAILTSIWTKLQRLVTGNFLGLCAHNYSYAALAVPYQMLFNCKDCNCLL